MTTSFNTDELLAEIEASIPKKTEEELEQERIYLEKRNKKFGTKYTSMQEAQSLPKKKEERIEKLYHMIEKERDEYLYFKKLLDYNMPQDPEHYPGWTQNYVNALEKCINYRRNELKKLIHS